MITGIVLAGGKSERMGGTKPLIEFKGKKLVRYPLDLLSKTCSEVFIVAKNAEPFSDLGARLVIDKHENQSPMVGIYSGLENSANNWAIVLACDMPFVREELIDGLNQKIQRSPNLHAIIPLAPEAPGGKPIRQVLVAAYSKAVLSYLQTKISEGNFSLAYELKEPQTRFPDWRELDPQDTNASSFININSPEEFQKWR